MWPKITFTLKDCLVINNMGSKKLYCPQAAVLPALHSQNSAVPGQRLPSHHIHCRVAGSRLAITCVIHALCSERDGMGQEQQPVFVCSLS